MTKHSYRWKMNRIIDIQKRVADAVAILEEVDEYEHRYGDSQYARETYEPMGEKLQEVEQWLDAELEALKPMVDMEDRKNGGEHA